MLGAYICARLKELADRKPSSLLVNERKEVREDGYGIFIAETFLYFSTTKVIYCIW
jgi:hypothetical protein